MIITLIAGTNRPGSNTKKLTDAIAGLLSEQNIPFHYLDLQQVPVLTKNEGFLLVENEILKPTTHYWIVMPEYNGSYPGVLKCLIDTSDVSTCWHHKKVILTGVASGRAGNLRGMEHLTGSLMHMKMFVHPNRLPVSAVDKLFDEQGNLTDSNTLKMLQQQLEQLLNF